MPSGLATLPPIEQGASWRVGLALRPQGTQPDGTPYPRTSLAGVAVGWEVRAGSLDWPGALLIDLGQKIDYFYAISEGTVFAQLSPSETAALPAGDYVFDVFFRQAGRADRTLRGSVSVRPRVTGGGS